jgi:hypothetical protein
MIVGSDSVDQSMVRAAQQEHISVAISLSVRHLGIVAGATRVEGLNMSNVVIIDSVTFKYSEKRFRAIR